MPINPMMGMDTDVNTVINISRNKLYVVRSDTIACWHCRIDGNIIHTNGFHTLYEFTDMDNIKNDLFEHDYQKLITFVLKRV